MEEALRRCGWAGQSIWAAGRTDAGVHAEGQVIAFDLDWSHSVSDLLNAVNANLPVSISVRHVEQVSERFHPRHDAAARSYRYVVIEDAVRQPLRERYAWRVWPPLDLRPAEEAAAGLFGRHDFAAFGSPHQPGGSTERIVHAVEFSRHERGVHIDVTANAFLYHMVRRIVFILVQIGQGTHNPDIIGQLLVSGDANLITGLAPAAGLCLREVIYTEDALEN